MSKQEENYTIAIEDKNLADRLKSFADSTGHTAEEITVQALREYFSKIDDDTGEDEVFDPDPGA